MPRTTVSVSEKLLHEVRPSLPLAGYFPLQYQSIDPTYGHNFPVFYRRYVRLMVKDSRINFGLKLIKGPIQTFTYFITEEQSKDHALNQTLIDQSVHFTFVVKGEDAEAVDYVIDNLNRFWLNGLEDVLTAIEWGFSCCQIVYDKDELDGDLYFRSLRRYDPSLIRPIIVNNSIVQAHIMGQSGYPEGLTLPYGKFIWHVHERTANPYYGKSRLEDCFVPWHELWSPYGARDIQRIWFRRNSFDGGTLYYPQNKVEDEFGNAVDARDIAMSIMSRRLTGGYTIFPNSRSGLNNGKEFDWHLEAPEGRVTPDGLMQYPENLRYEILEGMGIPPEVIESQGAEGFGSATGRKVPMLAYHSTLSTLSWNVVRDAFDWICRPLLVVKYKGKAPPVSLHRHIPLSSQENGGMPGGDPAKVEKDTGLDI